MTQAIRELALEHPVERAGHSSGRLSGDIDPMWLDSGAEGALTRAVRDIEDRSSVEVAVAVRRAAGSWPHVPLIAAFVAAWLTLGYMLFGAPVFSLWTFLVDPLAAGALAAFVAQRMPPLVRWLTPSRSMRVAAEQAARATFVERGVYRTRQHTGVLVYVALAERMAVVIADNGVLSSVGEPSISAWEQSITAAVRHGGVATAKAIAAMGTTFSEALPRSDDDVDELPNEILHDIDRRPRT